MGTHETDDDPNRFPEPWHASIENPAVVEYGDIQLSHTVVSDERGEMLCIYDELDYGLRNWIESSMWCDVRKSR